MCCMVLQAPAHVLNKIGDDQTVKGDSKEASYQQRPGWVDHTTIHKLAPVPLSTHSIAQHQSNHLHAASAVQVEGFCLCPVSLQTAH